MRIPAPDRAMRCSEHGLRRFLIAALAASMLAPGAFAEPSTFTFDIAPENLARALNEMAQQSHIEISYSAELTRGKNSSSLKGTYTVEQALDLLLNGSGLRVRRITGGAWVIETGGNEISPSVVPGSSSDSASTKPMDEVIVTATKREEKLREVADSVTAFSGDELSQLGAQSFEDYIQRAPGVIYNKIQPNQSSITIRGVGTTTASLDQGQGTTGIYLNGIPLTDPSYPVSIPDIDTFDLQRVEVLRGPQGTLFGVATLGGAINYVTNPVRLDAFDARLESGADITAHNSSDVGYTAKAAFNLPILTDVLGVRVTAIKRFDPGYVDNIGTGRKDANSRDVESFRISALWQVNQRVSVNFLSFYDRQNIPDLSVTIPTLGDLKSDTARPQYFDFVTRINDLKVDADLNFATLTLDGSVSQKAQSSESDLTSVFGPDSYFPISAKNHVTNLEARLTSPGSRPLEWLVGVYHGAQHEDYPGSVYAQNQFQFALSQYYVYYETSEFAEVTYRFSDQWRATVGGRHHETSLQTETITGPAIDEMREKAGGFTPKASITFEPNSDFLTYALVSKGYRLGGVNLVPPNPNFPSPATYGSDNLVNYEIGVRPAWFEHRLTLDSTLFFINWTNIQLHLSRGDGYGYASNAGGAHNIGVENALNWTVTPNLQFQLSGTFLQAEISQTTDLGGGVVLEKGARLPGAPRWSSAALATYHWNTEYRPYVTASASIVSNAQSDFGTNTPSLPIMDYSLFGLRVGFHVKQFDFSVYANNIADRRGVTTAYYNGGGTSASDPTLDRIVYVQPRTVGLRLDWHL